MTFERAMEILSRDERFRATIYAMNTLLMKKGVYSAEEFEALFCEHAKNYQNGFRGAASEETETSREAVPASL